VAENVKPDEILAILCGFGINKPERLIIISIMHKAQVKLFQPRRARRGAVNRFYPSFVIFVSFVVR
jgi:hypothetical protein